MPLVRARWVVPVLGLGNTVGLTCAGIALLAGGAGQPGDQPPCSDPGVRRARASLGRWRVRAAGALVSAALQVTGFFPNAFVTLLACACAAAVFGVAVLALDGGDLRAVAARTAGRWFR